MSQTTGDMAAEALRRVEQAATRADVVFVPSMADVSATTAWLYAMPVYSSFRRDSGAQVIADTPEGCVEAMWAAKCEVDGCPWEAWEPTWRALHDDGSLTTAGYEEDIRVVPA